MATDDELLRNFSFDRMEKELVVSALEATGETLIDFIFNAVLDRAEHECQRYE